MARSYNSASDDFVRVLHAGERANRRKEVKYSSFIIIETTGLLRAPRPRHGILRYLQQALTYAHCRYQRSPTRVRPSTPHGITLRPQHALTCTRTFTFVVKNPKRQRLYL